MVGKTCHLPVLVFRSIERGVLRLGVHVKYVLSVPGVRVGIVLHGTHTPFLAPRHRSAGIRRRNFNFFTPTSTPLTRVSRSGGYPSDPTLVWNAPRSAASL